MKTIIAFFSILLLSVALGVGIGAETGMPVLPVVTTIFAGLSVAGAATPVSNALGSLFADMHKSSRNNMGGLRVIMYYGKYDDVETWPTLPDQESSSVSITTLATLTGDVVMKAGTRMFELYGTRDEVELKNSLVGPMDGQSFKQEIMIKHPGVAAKLLGFQGATNNEDLFFIVVNHAGTKFMVGSDGMPAKKTKDEGGTGKKVEDGSFTEMSFEAYGPTPAPVYTGTVPLTVAGSGSGS